MRKMYEMDTKTLLKKKTRFAPNLLKGILSVVFLAAVLVFTLMFLLFRDRITSDTLKGITRLITFSREDEAVSGEISFDAERETLCGFYDGKLAVLSGGRLALYGTGGNETFSRAWLTEDPALITSGGRVAAFDRGGGLLLSDGKDVLLELDGPVLGARFSSRQWLSVITRETGYRGVVTVYDNTCKPRYSWYSARRYILDAAVSPNGKRMAVATVYQQAEGVVGHIAFLDITKSSDAPEHELEIKDRLALSVLYPENDRVCVLTEDGAEFYDGAGEELGSYSVGDGVFIGYAAGQELLIISMKLSESAQISALVALDYNGSLVAELPVVGEINALTAAGEYFSVLAGSTLDIYNTKCEKIGSLADCTTAREIVQQSDGSVYLINGESARQYSPGRR